MEMHGEMNRKEAEGCWSSKVNVFGEVLFVYCFFGGHYGIIGFHGWFISPGPCLQGFWWVVKGEHYASEKPNFEVISRGTFEGLGWFSEGPNGQTYLLLDNWFQKWPKKSNYH